MKARAFSKLFLAEAGLDPTSPNSAPQSSKIKVNGHLRNGCGLRRNTLHTVSVFSADFADATLGLVIILIVAGAIASAQRWWQRTLEKKRNSEIRKRREWYDGVVIQHVIDNDKVLLRRFRQLCYRDPYGRLVTDRWDKELVYFFNTIIKPKLLNSNELDRLQALETLKCWGHECESGFDDFEPEVVEVSDGLGYERLVAAALVQCGFNVSFTPSSGDQGVDLVAERGGVRIALQCKNYATAVGNEAVQQIYAGAKFYGAGRAIVVAPNGYTKAALQLAGTLRVECLNHSEIGERLAALDKTAKEMIKTARPEGEHDTPILI